MRIGLYIGSFNPPHLGHKRVINFLLDNNYVDRILLLATQGYWNKNNLVDIKDRVNMLKYYESDRIIVDSIHNNYPYTYQVLNSLKNDYKGDEFYLIIGSDNLDRLHEWRNINDLLKYKFIVLKRGNIIKNNKISDDNFIYVDDFEYLDISSTEIRNGNHKYLDYNVKQYIINNNLYGGFMSFKNIIEKLTNDNKTISTMESCTGGGVSNAITNCEGASEVLKYSAVTYSNEYKIKMGVSKEVIDKYSVYSIETAKEMAKAISKYTNSNYGVGITGKLNRVDKRNPFGEDNVVFVSIYDKDNDKYYDSKIEAVKSSRSENKELVINEIISILENIIML